MPQNSNIAYELKGLGEMISALHGALFANGENGDIHRVLKTEAGQLAWRISEQLGPRTKEAATGKITRDVKQFLTDRPAYSNLDEGQQYSSTADFTWIEAGPNFLAGINDEDNQTGASGADALAMFRAGQQLGGRGKAYEHMGARGKQHVLRLNRTRVSKSALRYVVRSIEQKVGTLRASFAFTAAQLIPSKRIPAWLAKLFPSRANGRALFNEAGLNHPTEPFIEFGSTAKGVESNPDIAEHIRAAVKNSQYIMAEKLKKVIAGYAYDWNTGRVFHRREAQQEDES